MPFVYQLPNKVRIIMKIAYRLGLIDTPDDRKKFAALTNIALKTLSNQFGNDPTWSASTEIQSKYAQAIGFDLSHPSWCDPAYADQTSGNEFGREDTSLKFEDYLSRLLFEEEMVVHVRADNPSSREPVLTSVDIHSGQGSRAGEPLALYCDWSIGAEHTVGGRSFGFGEAFLRLSHAKHNSLEVGLLVVPHIGGAVQRIATVDNSEVSLVRKGTAPQWKQVANQGYLCGHYNLEDSPLAHIEVLDMTTDLQVEMYALKRDTVVASEDGCTDGVNKKAVLKALASKLMGKEMPDGRIILSTQKAKLEVRDTKDRGFMT